ncbi:MAG: endonuclease domain-containing protein [Clostridia bacterium]|nr:endonuclease domain-containing protein [Clostridia bacterium]
MQRKHNKTIIPTARTLRKNMTDEEKHLWYDFLRTYPVRFSRQKILGKYVADFYCAKAQLVIEIDGSEHYTEDGILYDRERTAFLEGYGLTVVRFLNSDIHKNFRGVCVHIDNLVRQSLSLGSAEPAPFTQGSLMVQPRSEKKASKKEPPRLFLFCAVGVDLPRGVWYNLARKNTFGGRHGSEKSS